MIAGGVCLWRRRRRRRGRRRGGDEDVEIFFGGDVRAIGIVTFVENELGGVERIDNENGDEESGDGVFEAAEAVGRRAHLGRRRRMVWWRERERNISIGNGM